MIDIFDDLVDDYENALFNEWYSYVSENVENTHERLVWKRAIIWMAQQKISFLLSNEYIKFEIDSEDDSGTKLYVSLTNKLYTKFNREYSSDD